MKYYLNTKAHPVMLIRKRVRAIKLLPLALPFFSVDLKGISPIFINNHFRDYKLLISN